MIEQPTIRVHQFAPKLGDVPANLETMLAAADRAAQDGVDLLVFPELALSGYTLEDHVNEVALRPNSPEMGRLKEASKHVALSFGFAEESSEHAFYNSGAYLEDGEIKHIHRKVYLPTYGLFEEGRYFGAGDSIRSFDSKFGRIAVLVCEDVWHLTVPYLAALDGARMILAVASGPLRGLDRQGEAKSSIAWERLLLTYSSSLAMFIVFANRVGFEDGVEFWGGSQILDPGGSVIAEAKDHEADELTARIDLDHVRRERIQTPLLRDERLSLVIRELQRTLERRERGADPGEFA